MQLRDQSCVRRAAPLQLRGRDKVHEVAYPIQRPAYNIEILPNLTEKEIKRIADRQAMARRHEAEMREVEGLS